MNTDHVSTLLTRFLEISLYVAAPLLIVTALVGIVVGIVQAATQINEPSISYAAKVVGLVAVLLFLGPVILDKLLVYTRSSFAGIATVVG